MLSQSRRRFDHITAVVLGARGRCVASRLQLHLVCAVPTTCRAKQACAQNLGCICRAQQGWHRFTIHLQVSAGSAQGFSPHHCRHPTLAGFLTGPLQGPPTGLAGFLQVTGCPRAAPLLLLGPARSTRHRRSTLGALCGSSCPCSRFGAP